MAPIAWTLASAIGYFIFSAFVKDSQNDFLRMNFAEEVLRFNARGVEEVLDFREDREAQPVYSFPFRQFAIA